MLVASTGQKIQVEETIPRDGKGRTYLSVKYPLRDENNRIFAIAGIKTEITKRKLAERKAQRAIRERDRFLAMLSHELRNPLAAIQNAANVLSRIESDDPRVRTVSEVVGRQSDQLSRILDDLLDISRVVQGKIELKKKLFDFRQSAEDAVLAVRSMATAEGITLTQSITEQSQPVFGDQSRMQQVFVNLLINAIKYTPAGGSVDLAINRVGDEVVASVTDTGAGMTERLIRRIFEPFVQGENTIDRAEGGMGVGLTLVKSLVELHGGQITAESPGLEQGSTFTVSVPISDAEILDHADAASESPMHAPAMKIVIVEDNADSRAMLQLALEMDGHTVIATHDGLAGLTTIEAEKPDVAFIDIGLPEIDGYEVARRLCQKGMNKHTMLFALTGFGQLKDIERALEAGFDHHITKPVNSHKLEQALARAARRKHEPAS